MEKKSIIKKWWFWVIIATLVMCIAMVIGAFAVPEEWLEKNSTTEPSNISSIENKTTESEASSSDDNIKLDYKITDSETDNLQRQTIRVTIPKSTLDNINEQDIKDFLKTLTNKQMNTFHPKGLCIFLYQEGDDTTGIFTVAKCEYAPNGKWGDIFTEGSTKDYSKYDYNIELADLAMQEAIRELTNKTN